MSSSRKTATTFATFAAVALVAAALVTAGLAGNWNSADAQANNRAVTNFGMGHNNSWHLTFHWDEPAHGIPRDYRVMWAKSSDNYKTWTDESGNAFPTTNSHTVTDVERGVEYKAKVRARYSDGSWPMERPRHATPSRYRQRPHRHSNRDARTDCRTRTGPPLQRGNRSTDDHGLVRLVRRGETPLDTTWSRTSPRTARTTGPTSRAPSDETNTRAFVHGSAAIIVEPYAGPVHLRVRATFDDGTATDWYGVSVNTSE